MGARLNRISRFIIRYCGWISIVGLVAALAGAYFSFLLYKNLRTDIEELLPTNARSGRDLKELTQRLESFDYLAVLVFSKDTRASLRFVDDLAARLNTLPKALAASVEYRVGDETQF